MADPKLSEQLKVSVIKSLPKLAAKTIQLSYRGIVISIHFIKQLLVDALGK